LAFRVIAANAHPDHATHATFRKRFAQAFAAVLVQVLQVARENPLSRFGTVSLDGTNASRHRALSSGHADDREAQLKAEVQELLALAEAADGVNVPDGINLPEELPRREDRLAAIAVANATIDARAAKAAANQAANRPRHRLRVRVPTTRST
jgi:hypothetical protein